MTKQISGRARDRRPLSVTVISWLFIAAGAVGFVYHVREFKIRHPFQDDVVWVCLIRLVAMLCGWCMLRGRNWARWLASTWIVYHVILSALHSWSETLAHSVLFAVVACFLFRPRATEFFRQTRT